MVKLPSMKSIARWVRLNWVHTMSTLRTYYHRILLPSGHISNGLTHLAVELDHSARIRLERETDGTVITLLRLPAWVTGLLDIFQKFGRRRVRPEDLAGFLRDLSLMLAAGVPALEALRTLVAEGEVGGNLTMASMAARMADDLNSGVSISESFNRHPDVFPETVRNLIAIGDQSGTLDRMLGEAASHVERMIDIKRDIRTALIYPAFVFATIFAVAGFWIYYVVPSMAELFKQLNAKLPAVTQALVGFSNTLVNHGWIVLIIAIFIGLAVYLLLRHVPAAHRLLHEILHKLPVARVLMTSSGMAYITEHLAILVRAGLDFVTCLNILTRTTHNQH